MKTFMRILSDIALVVSIVFLMISIYNIISSGDFTFGIVEIIFVSALLIFIIFSKNKKDAFVDIWNFIDLIRSIF